jgi:ABC-2 type transport system permease protein
MIRNVALIAGRELRSYFRTPMGYIIAAVLLAVDGLLFNVFAMGTSERFSADVIKDFFYFSAGTTMVLAILISMRLFAEERQMGTLVFLRTAPVSDGQAVAGKFLAAVIYVTLVTLLTLPMPLLIMVNGKVAAGHLVAGYMGLILLGSASVAIGALGSAFANNQVVAAITSTAMLMVLLLSWLLARVTEPPLGEILSHLSLFDKHFTPFMRGMIHTRDIVYYLSVTYFFLLLSTLVLKSRRWR